MNQTHKTTIEQKTSKSQRRWNVANLQLLLTRPFWENNRHCSNIIMRINNQIISRHLSRSRYFSATVDIEYFTSKNSNHFLGYRARVNDTGLRDNCHTTHVWPSGMSRPGAISYRATDETRHNAVPIFSRFHYQFSFFALDIEKRPNGIIYN